ncbi:hypothetical protein NECAME_11313 [Necator americanus]|uniref:Uncharacterized protein n=1 Tax=Necator americanus TaxID=51031 RepID=W2T7B0_NECAM|nr:hypothetical protein NECAME_11313 [Necator americanus]ETN77056.1 hypothetical protein NECAME_11313 [Necator americanus]
MRHPPPYDELMSIMIMYLLCRSRCALERRYSVSTTQTQASELAWRGDSEALNLSFAKQLKMKVT